MAQARQRAFLGLGAAVGLVLGVGGLSTLNVGCETGTVSDQLVVTSTLLRADQLSRGIGCGERPGQLYKYAVVVSGRLSDAGPDSDVFVTGGVFDCFADAAFPRMDDPRQPTNPRFVLKVFLYDKDSFLASRAAIEAAVVTPTTNADLAQKTSPIGETECTATQRENVQTVAACEIPTPIFSPAKPDASTDAAPGDAAPSDSATDAPLTDASTSEASTDATAD